METIDGLSKEGCKILIDRISKALKVINDFRKFQVNLIKVDSRVIFKLSNKYNKTISSIGNSYYRIQSTHSLIFLCLFTFDGKSDSLYIKFIESEKPTPFNNVNFYYNKYFQKEESASWWETRLKEDEHKKYTQKELFIRSYEIHTQKSKFLEHLITKLKKRLKDAKQ